MYEAIVHRPLSRARFLRRVGLHTLAAAALLLGSLALGMIGYHLFEHLPWLDAFLNASMLLGGMGPVDTPRTDSGKLFAGLYALYAGLVFLVSVSLVLTPIVHRLMHKIHWPEER